MTNYDYTDYFTWLDDGGWIRVSVRAIILNSAGDRTLVEHNVGLGATYLNFIGGGVETNETLLQCLERELAEEVDAKIVTARYLFVVENFIPHGDEWRHALEHYFQLELDRETVMPAQDGVELVWVPVERLGELDLRPVVVRDVIADGSYERVRHLVMRGSAAEFNSAASGETR